MPQGIKKFIDFAKTSAKEVPAYRRFLKDHKIDLKTIQVEGDFQTLPVMDKRNYINKYPFTTLYSSKKIPGMIYASSGSSGQPSFWMRDDLQEQNGGETHLRIFRDIFGIKPSEPTLVIVCFSTGIWVAGNFTLAACRYISRQGFNLTTVTPGIEKEDIFNCLKNLAPNFKNVILAGYPPFVMDIMQESIKRGISIKKIKIITAGDKFSEEWRDALTRLLKHKDPFRSIVSIYGCADAGILGFETPLSIFLRKKSLVNPQLYQALFGREDILPALVQYDPKYVLFEELNSELIFTARTSIPLIRYNIHDIGNLFTYEHMVSILGEFKLLDRARSLGLTKSRLPFVVKKGRTDVAVSFYAINIYPEHLRSGIEDKRVAKFLTGNFSAYNKEVQNQKQQKFFIKLQLRRGTNVSKKIKDLVLKTIFDNLIKVNIEYRKLFSAIGYRALPEIIFTNQYNFVTPHVQGISSIQGKKPNVIAKN